MNEVCKNMLGVYVKLSMIHEEILALEKALSRKKMEMAQLLEPTAGDKANIEQALKYLAEIAKPKEAIIDEEVESRG